MLAKHKDDDANAPPKYGMKIKNLVDFGRVRLQYTQNGRVVDEQLGVILTCQESESPAMPLLRRPAMSKRTCFVHGTPLHACAARAPRRSDRRQAAYGADRP